MAIDSRLDSPAAIHARVSETHFPQRRPRRMITDHFVVTNSLGEPYTPALARQQASALSAQDLTWIDRISLPGAFPETQADVGPNLSSFIPGDHVSKAPWEIRARVRELLLQQIPSKPLFGHIYVFQVQHCGPPIVKIGSTYQPINKRRGQIQYENDHGLDGETMWSGAVDIDMLKYVEQLVHRDLASFQRKLPGARGQLGAMRVEYFEIEKEKAYRAVEFWIEAVKKLGLRPGGYLQLNKETLISLNRELQPPRQDSQNTRRRANEDHDETIRFWRRHLLKEQSPDATEAALALAICWPVGSTIGLLAKTLLSAPVVSLGSALMLTLAIQRLRWSGDPSD